LLGPFRRAPCFGKGAGAHLRRLILLAEAESQPVGAPPLQGAPLDRGERLFAGVLSRALRGQRLVSAGGSPPGTIRGRSSDRSLVVSTEAVSLPGEGRELRLLDESGELAITDSRERGRSLEGPPLPWRAPEPRREQSRSVLALVLLCGGAPLRRDVASRPTWSPGPERVRPRRLWPPRPAAIGPREAWRQLQEERGPRLLEGRLRPSLGGSLGLRRRRG